jgi:HD domain
MLLWLAMGNRRHSSESLVRLRKEIYNSATDPQFIHHVWYVQYHLELVEAIASELIEYHPEADPELVYALVWIHDYGKMVTRHNDREATLIEGRKKLLEVGYPEALVDRIITYAKVIDSSSEVDLTASPIEIKIVSSADGCSHLVGPFFHLWFWENSDRPFEQLMQSNRRKALQAWERKIVLPEARAAFKCRHNTIMELNGFLPERFIPRPSSLHKRDDTENPGG